MPGRDGVGEAPDERHAGVVNEDTAAHEPDQEQDAAQHWNARYGERKRMWSGAPNRALVEAVGDLAPGRALDLGCGEGADSVWLATGGWQVTGVDISSTAIERAGELASERGVSDQTSWIVDGPRHLDTAGGL